MAVDVQLVSADVAHVFRLEQNVKAHQQQLVSLQNKASLSRMRLCNFCNKQCKTFKKQAHRAWCRQTRDHAEFLSLGLLAAPQPIDCTCQSIFRRLEAAGAPFWPAVSVIAASANAGQQMHCCCQQYMWGVSSNRRVPCTIPHLHK